MHVDSSTGQSRTECFPSRIPFRFLMSVYPDGFLTARSLFPSLTHTRDTAIRFVHLSVSVSTAGTRRKQTTFVAIGDPSGSIK